MEDICSVTDNEAIYSRTTYELLSAISAEKNYMTFAEVTWCDVTYLARTQRTLATETNVSQLYFTN